MIWNLTILERVNKRLLQIANSNIDINHFFAPTKRTSFSPTGVFLGAIISSKGVGRHNIKINASNEFVHSYLSRANIYGAATGRNVPKMYRSGRIAAIAEADTSPKTVSEKE